jgi:K+-sensing histidine kinase KdpD
MLVEPPYSLAIVTVADAVALAVFLLVGTVISLLGESLHRSRYRTGAIERRRADPVPHATEDALRESEERFRGTFHNAAVGIVSQSEHQIDGNGASCRLWVAIVSTP